MHHVKKLHPIVTAMVCLAFLCGTAEPVNSADARVNRFASLAAAAEAQQHGAVAGLDGWLFLTAELHHLGVGPFWGADAKEVSRAANRDAADPLPAILDFNTQLKQAGIELILMPVPPKAAIYCDKLLGAGVEPPGSSRADAADAAFYPVCKEQGIKVLDLGPAFLSARETNAPGVYCQTDSHWSGRGCVLAAELLSREIRTRSWCANVPKKAFKSEWREVGIEGDLGQLVQPKVAPEKLSLRFVSDADGTPPADWRESPIVILGDSHTLVFHAGDDMHGSGAGLADQLALELGFPMDVVGVRGSGATPARINLLRRKDNLAGKKLVIWCFSAREFTEATGGWRLVPVINKK